jgi:hypothetical protein
MSFYFYIVTLQKNKRLFFKILQRWFFPNINRDEAERLLNLPMNTHGSFLLRPKSHRERNRSKSLALSVLCLNDGEFGMKKTICHYSLKSTSNGKYYIIESRLFDTLNELVSYYSGEIHRYNKLT